MVDDFALHFSRDIPLFAPILVNHEAKATPWRREISRTFSLLHLPATIMYTARAPRGRPSLMSTAVETLFDRKFP